MNEVLKSTGRIGAHHGDAVEQIRKTSAVREPHALQHGPRGSIRAGVLTSALGDEIE